MANSKLVAFRCDADTLSKVDSYCSGRKYMNRSLLINQILKVVLTCSTPGTLQRMVETWDAYSAGFEVTLLKRGAAQ